VNPERDPFNGITSPLISPAISIFLTLRNRMRKKYTSKDVKWELLNLSLAWSLSPILLWIEIGEIERKVKEKNLIIYNDGIFFFYGSTNFPRLKLILIIQYIFKYKRRNYC